MSTNSKFGKVDINMIKKITHRFGWKILSVVLAFLLWLLVINYEDPIKTKPFDNLEVEKINANAITSQDLAIEYKEGLTVDIVVKGKKSIVDRLSVNDIRAFADLSKMSITGAIEIEVQPIEGIQVISKSPTSMMIALENIINMYKEVRYLFNGDPAEFYEALDPVITPNIVQISGPESQVNQVSSVTINISIEDIKKDITLLATPQLLDNSQKQVNNVTTNVTHVSVKVPIEKTRTIPIIVSNVKDLTEGYVITKKEQDLAAVTIRGKEEIVDTIDSINVSNISLEGNTKDTTIPVNLKDYLPNDIIIKNNETYLNLNYTIAKLEEKTMTILTQDISVKNLPEGLKFSYLNDIGIDLTFKGIQTDLDKITLETLNPYIRLYGLLPEEQATPLFYTIPASVELVSEPPVLSIRLVEEELQD